jgi:ABC-type sugar transport system ATPase subunit
MIELQHISLRAGTFQLQELNLRVPAGSYAVLMGGTGQGKTTILEAICGLRPVAGGKVWLGGRDVTRERPANRNVGYVPQDLALFPTLNVREHLEFAPRLRRYAASQIASRVAELAAALEIEPLLDRSVQDLSGGEAQRVALGRALSFEPQVLILDEPLNALDDQTHGRLCELLRQLQRQYSITTLHVTHSRREARLLADQLLVLERGQIRQGSLQELDQDLQNANAAATVLPQGATR